MTVLLECIYEWCVPMHQGYSICKNLSQKLVNKTFSLFGTPIGSDCFI